MEYQWSVYAWYIFSAASISIAFVQLFGIHRFQSLSSLTIIKKRYPVLVLLEAAIAFVVLLILCPIVSKAAFVPEYIIDYPHWFAKLVQYVAVKCIITIGTGRLWMMSLDLHHLHYSQNQQWKAAVDESSPHPLVLYPDNTLS